MRCVPANAALLPERVEKVAQERIAAGTYQTLVFGVVEDDKSEVVTFGKLDNGEAPDGDTVYYVGAYKLAEEFLLHVFRMNDVLFSRATGQGAIPILPFAPDEFFATPAGASLSFTRGPDRLVNGLVLHQNGDCAAPKLSPSELPPEFQEIALGAIALGDYVGNYRFDFGVLDVALKGDHLEAQLTGQLPVPIFASVKDKFFCKVVEAQLEFERDGGGRVVAVVLHQNACEIRAPRIMTHGTETTRTVLRSARREDFDYCAHL
jgi:Domain of unknown function (DUF3471)